MNEEDEMSENYWDSFTLAEFWIKYEVVYEILGSEERKENSINFPST